MTRRNKGLLALLASLLMFLLIASTGCSGGVGPEASDDVDEGASSGPENGSSSSEGGGDPEDETGGDGEPGEPVSEPSEGDAGGSGSEEGEGQELAWLEPLFCDHPLYDGEEWIEVEAGDLVLRYLPGSPAEADIDRIASDRQASYDEIVDFLGLESRPQVTVVLSPNRMAARHHGYATGRAFKSQSRVEVLWPAGEDSYERKRPGHELAHVLAVHVDGQLGRLAFLDEGLAEYLDGSGRDLHQEYVDKLLSGHEVGPPTRMDDWDAWGMNYGRAGSFVAFLVERYGRERFLDLWRAAATTGGWAQITTLGDVVEDGPSLERALDSLLRQSHGFSFEAARLAWEAALEPYFERPPTSIPEDDLLEMLSVVAYADAAIARSDAVGFRAALEGFYCDSWTDDEKAVLAREVVVSYDRVDTTVISAFPVGIRNYREAVLHTVRREVRAGEAASLRTGMLWMERFPEGWRISWATAW